MDWIGIVTIRGHARESLLTKGMITHSPRWRVGRTRANRNRTFWSNWLTIFAVDAMPTKATTADNHNSENNCHGATRSTGAGGPQDDR